MSEEAVVAAPEAVESAPVAAPDAEVTATPAASPVEGEGKPEADKPAKSFSQEEVDKLIGERLAKAERKWQREQAKLQAAKSAEQPSQPVQAQAVVEKPTPDKFKTTEEYVEAVAEWKADQLIGKRLAEREQKVMQSRVQESEQVIAREFAQQVEAAREKYSDYDDVVGNPMLRITDAMRDAIVLSEQGTDLAYHLGKNPKEAARIAALPPILQAKELGKLEARLASEPPPKTPSSAPAPINPISRATSAARVIDTTDPRSIKDLSTSEWIALERERQIRKMQKEQRT